MTILSLTPTVSALTVVIKKKTILNVASAVCPLSKKAANRVTENENILFVSNVH